MYTKKLVLGFCVLAAVTGSAPHVFGEESLQSRLAEAIHDDRIRVEHQAALAATEQKLHAEVVALASMGEDEVRLVREAVLKARRAHILCESHALDDSKLRAIDASVACIQSDLDTAVWGAANGATFFRERNEAEVDRLKSILAEARQPERRILEQRSIRRSMIIKIRGEMRQARKEAYALHDQRVAHVTALCDTTIRERERSLHADLDGFGSLWNYSIDEIVQMEMRAIGDLAALNAAELIRSDVIRVSERIKEAVREEHDDYAWFHDVTGLDREVYDKWQASFYATQLVYNPDEITLTEPLDRLRGALAPSEDIEVAVRINLNALAHRAKLAC
jgi:hypothetical protein